MLTKNTFRYAIIIAVVLVILTGFSYFSGLAAPYEVSVSVTPVKLASPGDIVTQVFTVINEGDNSDTYQVELDLPKDWSTLPFTKEKTLGSDGKWRIFVNVVLPSDAKAGLHQISLQVTSTTPPAVTASATTQIEVKSISELTVKWSKKPGKGKPGGRSSSTVSVRNSGNVPDRYSVSVNINRDWEITAAPKEFSLAPGETREVPVTFSVPEGAESGARYRLQVTVRSVQKPELEKSLSVSGTLTPPPPELVTGNLYPNWDVTTGLSVGNKGKVEFTFDGQASLRRFGDFSTSISLNTDGLKSASGQVIKDNWGVILDSGSIAGSYLSVSGMPLFMGTVKDEMSYRVLFTEENKGLSLAYEKECCDLRGVIARNETKDLFFEDLEGGYDFPGPVEIFGSISHGATQTSSGKAYRVQAVFDEENFTLNPSYYRIEAGYPKKSQAQGWAVNASLARELFSLNSSLSYDRTRTGEEPNQLFINELAGNINPTFELGENLTYGLSLDMNRKRSEDSPVSTNQLGTAFSSSIRGRTGALSWSIGFGINKTDDFANGTETISQSVSGSLGLELDPTYHSFTASIQREKGTGGTSLSSDFTYSFSATELPVSPRFSITRNSDGTSFSFDITKSEPTGPSINWGIKLQRSDEVTVSSSLSSSFSTIFPFCGPTKARVKGHVFMDSDGDSNWDEDESGLQEIYLTLDGRRAVTGTEGLFAFPPVKPGKYSLDLSRLPTRLKPAVDFPLTVDLQAGDEKVLDIPMKAKSWISGIVYDDENENGTQDPGETGTPGIAVNVRGKEVNKTLYTDSRGKFLLDVISGTYTVEVIAEKLPERTTVTTTSPIEITVQEAGEKEVGFGVYQKPRPVKVTFGPPKALFICCQTEPKTWDIVQFDASSSEARGGEIRTYKWTIAHEEEKYEFKGEKLSIAFPIPGTWRVKLTVIDSNGLKGTQTKLVEVKAAE